MIACLWPRYLKCWSRRIVNSRPTPATCPGCISKTKQPKSGSFCGWLEQATSTAKLWSTQTILVIPMKGDGAVGTTTPICLKEKDTGKGHGSLVWSRLPSSACCSFTGENLWHLFKSADGKERYWFRGHQDNRARPRRRMTPPPVSTDRSMVTGNQIRNQFEASKVA